YAAGYTLKLPLEERKLQSRKEFFDDIAVSLGGLAAEEMIFGDITTGASNDLQVSTALARNMVVKYGMSDRIGPVAFEGGGKTLNGLSQFAERTTSEAVAAVIDEEVSKIMTEAFERAKKVLLDHKAALDALSQELIAKETIERNDFEKLLILHGIKPKERASAIESAPVTITD
ncbi:MAG TPA: cell division protein FtsH, partial [Candidatus Paceibacterota bacterium]|nr:cell division protein FtsH [Candidatus Paceibacterota bacterium]